jgi:hypothetical protein
MQNKSQLVDGTRIWQILTGMLRWYYNVDFIFIVCILLCILLEALACPSTQQSINKTDINVLISV